MSRSLDVLQEKITRQIAEERQREMAEAIAASRRDAQRADARLAREAKALAGMGLDLANLEALDREMSGEADSELREIEARLDSQSHVAPTDTLGADVDMGLLPEGAQVLTPAWTAAFSSHDLQAANTASAELAAQTLLSGGACKSYYNWASGAGSGLAGTGVGKIQSWVEFGFWFRPSTSRFYSVRPLFRFRGYVIVRADDGFFTSKSARVTGSVWTNVHQYNWKGWNSTDVYNIGGGNINVNTRQDLDRYTNNSYLLGGGDWAFIRCVIGLWAYARGSGSYAKNDFATGNANYLCVPHAFVV